VSERDEHYMQQALSLARQASAAGEVPVGAVVVYNDSIIAEGWNRPISSCDPTAHAEIVALRQAATFLGNYRLVNCELYVTLEPCIMCAGAIIHSRIQRLVFGALEPKAGVIQSNVALLNAEFTNHRLDVKGSVLAEPCGLLISEFFQQRRAQKKSQRDATRQNNSDDEFM